jgi:hypothetical protein
MFVANEETFLGGTGVSENGGQLANCHPHHPLLWKKSAM